jgi:SAM-dependent methyltransferase
MRTTMKSLIEILDRTCPFSEPVVEFGAFQVRGQEARAVRPLFSNRWYVGADMRIGPGTDLALDLHSLGLRDGSSGTAILLDTVEHVQYFWRASQEVYRVLRPGGIAIFTSVMYFPIHAYPSDYWRFTPEGFRVLGEPFDEVLIESAGLAGFPHTVVAIGMKEPIDEARRAALEAGLAEWKRRYSQTWKEVVVLLLPPVLLVPLYDAFTNLAARLTGSSHSERGAS